MINPRAHCQACGWSGATSETTARRAMPNHYAGATRSCPKCCARAVPGDPFEPDVAHFNVLALDGDTHVALLGCFCGICAPCRMSNGILPSIARPRR